MSSNKANSKAEGGSQKKKAPESDADSEAQLHKEYETLSEILDCLKRRAVLLRRENETLQNEVTQRHLESQEYIAYMLDRKKKHQNALVTLDIQKQQTLEELNKEKEEMMTKHEEQVNGLKKEIMMKESELSELNLEIDEIGDVKSLLQQQLDHIAELEQQVAAARCFHSETLHALESNRVREKEHHKAESKIIMKKIILNANKINAQKTSHLQNARLRQLCEENHHLQKELHQLILTFRALQRRQQLLQTQRRQLLLDVDCLQELQRLHNSTPRGIVRDAEK